jgi:hypothetical protein
MRNLFPRTEEQILTQGLHSMSVANDSLMEINESLKKQNEELTLTVEALKARLLTNLTERE